MWAVMSDVVKHFNECLDMDDMVGRSQVGIVWPCAELTTFAHGTMAGGQDINLHTLSEEWSEAVNSYAF